MNKELQIFNFKENAIRTILNENDEVWFIAKDICNILEISDVSQAVSRLDEDEKLNRSLYVSGQNRNILLVNESGMYSLTLTSRKPEAKAFKKFVTSEVLPSIRKTGSYNMNGFVLPDFNNPIIAARAWANEVELKQIALFKIEEQEAIIETQANELEVAKPKVLFTDTVIADEELFSIGKAAKLLNLGRNTLFELLREKKFLLEDNTPSQHHINCKRATFKYKRINKPNKSIKVSLITGKGLFYIYDNYLIDA